MSTIVKPIKTKNTGDSQGLERGGEEWGVAANGSRVAFGSDKNVLELDSDDGCTIL